MIAVEKKSKKEVFTFAIRRVKNIRPHPRDYYGFLDKEQWRALKAGKEVEIKTSISSEEFQEKYSEFEVVKKERLLEEINTNVKRGE